MTAWESFGATREEYAKLPPDLTRRWRYAGLRMCLSWPNQPSRHWFCTRQAGHTGRHAAGDGRKIREVW